jgi:hypothetical protein
LLWLKCNKVMKHISSLGVWWSTSHIKNYVSISSRIIKIICNIFFFSQTRRRAAHLYIKKKRWVKAPRNQVVFWGEKPAERTPTQNMTLPLSLSCWQLGEDVSHSSSPS